MIEVKGYINDLFRGMDIDNLDLGSLENTPIMRNHTKIGMVTSVDAIKGIWYGYLNEPLVSFAFDDTDQKHHFASLFYI